MGISKRPKVPTSSVGGSNRLDTCVVTLLNRDPSFCPQLVGASVILLVLWPDEEQR
jgi:hypothetical protein